MRNRINAACATLLLGILGAAGCANSGGTPSEPVLPRPFGGVLAYGQYERQALHAANERLIADCMRRRGHVYEPEGLATGRPDPEDGNPYWLLTTEQARQDGYGITSSRLNTRMPRDPNKARSGEREWREALLGTTAHRVHVRLPGRQEFFYNADACLTKARDTLYGADYERLYNTYQVLAMQVVSAVHKDSRYLKAQRRWSGCMRDAGVRAGTLDDPRSSVDQRLRRAAADQGELRAVARHELKLSRQDASCQRKTGLARTVTEAQKRAEKAVAGDRRSGLVRLRTLRDAAVRRATDT
ncbi:hypothetical protein ACH4TX_03960 [Streptomyces sp. NPDC021098]|uniref:hypothetical protein n=1 Tax=unclassified Streptomyces TaxID=2593676 RepID=UPI003799B3FB